MPVTMGKGELYEGFNTSDILFSKNKTMETANLTNFSTKQKQELGRLLIANKTS